MKLLLKAALRSRQHLSLLIITFATLLCLTVASQMEMFALGVLSNNGADFFSLFSPEKSVEGPRDTVSLHAVEARWPEIDTEGTGVITKQQAAAYLTAKETNPLNWLLREFKQHFQFASSVNALVIILVCVAVFKAIWLFASRYTTQILSLSA